MSCRESPVPTSISLINSTRPVWGVTGAVVLAGLYVFVGLDRNTLLSLVAGTSPGHVTLEPPRS
jgi:hypothetical protein